MTDAAAQPLITVVIAVYNGQSTLQQCLDSVKQQSYKNVELVVIDGGSTDGTVDLLVTNTARLDYWISEPDKGIYNAWNKALAKASGDWICFLGADDYFYNLQVLESMAAHLIEIPWDVRVVYGQIMLLGQNDRPMFLLGQPWSNIQDRFKWDMCIPHPAVLHRCSLFEKNGHFDESYRIAGDYELLLRELKEHRAVFVPGVVMTGMRQGGASSTPANTLLTLREVRRAQISAGLLWPRPGWLMAMTRARFRIFLWGLLGERFTRKLLDIGRRLLGMPAYWTKT